MRVNECTKRKVIGKYPILSVSVARELAKDKIRELTTDNCPVTTSATFPTVSVAYKDDITQIQLKPSSIYEYNVVYRHYLTSLVNTPLDQVTEDIIINLYLTNCKRSVSQANKAMKITQAVTRFSGVSNNPVTVLARRRIRRQLKPGTSHIPLTDLPLFYKGLEKAKYKVEHIIQKNRGRE